MHLFHKVTEQNVEDAWTFLKLTSGELQQGVMAFDASFMLSKYFYGHLTPHLLDSRFSFVATSKKNTDCNLIHNFNQSDDNMLFVPYSFHVPCEPVTSD